MQEILNNLLHGKIREAKEKISNEINYRLLDRVQEITEEISNDLFYGNELKEASKERLSAYINAATSDYGNKVGRYMSSPDTEKEKLLKGVVKRKMGISTATEKLASGDYTGSEPTGMLKTIKDIRAKNYKTLKEAVDKKKKKAKKCDIKNKAAVLSKLEAEDGGGF